MAATNDGDRTNLDHKLEELQRLQKEFERIRERLQRAEEEKHTVNRRVYERVRGEYDRQLDALRAQMTPLRTALDDVRGEYEDHLGDANARLESIEEEMAEVVFRHRIGEYTDEEMAARRADIDERLQKSREQIDDLKTVLEAMDNAGPSPLHQSSDAPAGAPAAPAGSRDEPTETPHWPEPPAEHAAVPPADPAPQPAAEDAVESPAGDTPESPPAEDVTRRPVIRSRDLETARAASFENPQAWVEEIGPEARTAARDATSRPASTPSSTDTTDPASRPNPSLVFVSGPHAGQSIALLKTTLTIGREHDNNIELKDADVARYHARILSERGQFIVEDMASTTGTWMNGERVQRAPLKHGDVIRIGQTEMAIDFEWALDSLQRSRVDPAA